MNLLFLALTVGIALVGGLWLATDDTAGDPQPSAPAEGPR